MARKRNKNRRRRRGRFSFLLKLFCIALMIAAIIAALTIFFKVQKIVVEGNERYDEAQVIEASGLKIEDNLFLLNKYGVAQTIFETLPYVEEAAINRKLPDTILITVRECSAAAGVEANGAIWLVSENGKLLEEVSALPEGIPAVTGIAPVEPVLSGELTAAEGEENAVETLLILLQKANEYGMLADMGSIDLTDAAAIRLGYLGRFEVKLPWNADISYALQMLRSAAGTLESNETGEISLMNLMDEGRVNFIPRG